MPYPSRRYDVSVPTLHQIPRRIQAQYAVSRILYTPYLRIIIHEDSGRYQTWSLLQESLIRRNLPSERRQLWSDLGMHKYVVWGFPWVLMGNFNVALNLKDSFSGSSTLNSAMYDFKACLNKIEFMDINSTGLHYTWNQKPKGGGGVLKKLDRIIDNIDFIDSFPGAYAIFQPYRISDHSPAVLKLPTLISPKPKPFKFFNFLAFKTRFIEVMESHWNT
ncbi:hypothetical protein Tco_1493548 [Tanacetum coccineum]